MKVTLRDYTEKTLPMEIDFEISGMAPIKIDVPLSEDLLKEIDEAVKGIDDHWDALAKEEKTITDYLLCDARISIDANRLFEPHPGPELGPNPGVVEGVAIIHKRSDTDGSRPDTPAPDEDEDEA